jgi:uncharacterized CHY-type Zn-finger protein
MIVFASPGMLHAGYSLHLFKKWAPEEKNMVCHVSILCLIFLNSLYTDYYSRLLCCKYCWFEIITWSTSFSIRWKRD